MKKLFGSIHDILHRLQHELLWKTEINSSFFWFGAKSFLQFLLISIISFK